MNHYTFDELKTGMEADFEVTVTEQMHESFMQLSGDENPMHTDAEYAKSRGYDGKLVYGMLTASFYSRLVGMYLPGEYCIFHQADASFNAAVYVGDTLYVHGEIVELHEGFKRAKIKAYIKNGSGKKVSRAMLTVGVDR